MLTRERLTSAGIGLACSVITAICGAVIHSESVTAVHTTQITEVRARLDRQDDTNEKLAAAVADLNVNVATLTARIESRSPRRQVSKIHQAAPSRPTMVVRIP